MSFAVESVYTSPRRPDVEEPYVDPLAAELAASEVLLQETIRALDHLEEALDQSIQGIRARGAAPDEQLLAPMNEMPY